MKKSFSTNTIWEQNVSYSRAVRVGNFIEVAGTTAVMDGKCPCPGQAGPQAQLIFEKIEHALQQVGAKKSDVVRTRMYVTNIQDFQEVGEAHGEFFKGINPASTLVEISALVNDELVVEIEASAIIDPDESI